MLSVIGINQIVYQTSCIRRRLSSIENDQSDILSNIVHCISIIRRGIEFGLQLQRVNYLVKLQHYSTDGDDR